MCAELIVDTAKLPQKDPWQTQENVPRHRDIEETSIRRIHTYTHIEMNPDAKPAVQRHRPVQHHLEERIKKKS